MEYRTFGNTSLRVSALGIGCSRLGGTSTSDKEVLATLLGAFDRGINFYDTADVYAQGQSEKFLGATFKRNRAAVVIATKAGYHLTAAGRLGTRLKPFLGPAIRLAAGLRRQAQRIRPTPQDQSFSAQHLMAAIEGSLRRLQPDYLDIFQLHNPPSTVVERGEFIATLEHAKSQGKIRCYGISCRRVADAEFCLLYPSISAVQIPINLLQFENVLSFLELAKRKNVAVVARQPFASGLLSRPTVSLKSRHFSLGEDAFREQLERVRDFQFLELANRRTIAQAALQFVLQLSGVSVVVAGMSTRKHLDDNLAAAARPITQDEIAQIYVALGHKSVEVQ
jgi:aryl-alcohol dehydrogenase-like predicted oxidoreductase